MGRASLPRGGKELALGMVWEQVFSVLEGHMAGWLAFFAQFPFTLLHAKQVAAHWQQPPSHTTCPLPTGPPTWADRQSPHPPHGHHHHTELLAPPSLLCV